MLRFVLIILTFIVIPSSVISQNHFEAYIGLNHSNIIHNWGEQILYNHTLNSPLWNYGFQLGVNKNWAVKNNFLTAGIRFQLKGDRKSLHEVFPISDFYGLRFLELMLPINLELRVLHSKDIFLKAGISGNYLLSQNKVRGLAFFPIHRFTDKLGVSGQIGFKFKVKERNSVELMYSQNFTNIYAIPIVKFGVNSPPEKITYKHQAFELSVFYRV